MLRKLEDIEVWNRSRRLTVLVYQLAMREPLCKDWGLRDQMQRAAIPIASNIAEGFERNSQAEFRRFLHIAKGSCGELKTQLLVLNDLNILPVDELEELIKECSEISLMLGGLASSITRKR